MTKNRNSLDKEMIEKLQRYNYEGKITRLIEKIDNDYKKAKQLADLMKEEISLTPGNVSDALKRVSEKTGIAYGTLQARYFSKKPFKAYSEYFPDPCNKHNMESVFYIIGRDGYLSNTKNTSNKKDYRKNKFVFALLKKLLKLK